MDDFHEPASNANSATFSDVLTSHISLIVAGFLAPFVVVLATRFLSERASEEVNGKNERTVWVFPYWIPIIGHAFSFLYDPLKLMIQARDRSPHGIFSLHLVSSTHNVISNPTLVKDVMAQKEAVVNFSPIAWNIMHKFFGFPQSSKKKYDSLWKEFHTTVGYLTREPWLGQILKPTIRNLEENISQMITFVDSEIDLQPWERWAKASYISNSETEINLMSLMRDMLGHASVPALFGRAILEKYPELLHDIYDLDSGIYFFLMGLPAWTPWPGVMKAHLGRYKTWEAMDDFERALDALADARPVDPSWGELDDVSGFIQERHKLYKENGFDINERGDVSILWASVVNANLLVYWQLLYILSTPGLVDRIREEVAPFATVSKPLSIGNISEAPKLTISHEGLSNQCPLLKSTYLEALRMSNQSWSVRKVAEDLVIGNKKSDTSPAFLIRKGEYITVPHDLHMRDPKYFKDPKKFDPERFLVQKEDGSLSTDMKTIRPYGGGPSMCPGRLLAERECLALVAGVLVSWEIEPADKNAGWIIPKQAKTSGVSKPVHDTRIRIRRRQMESEAEQ